MRERTFAPPTVKKILEINGFDPGNANQNYILKNIYNGRFILSGLTYREAVSAVESLEKPENKGKIVLFHPRFGFTKEAMYEGIKSLDWLAKIDSQACLRAVSKDENIPSQLTKEFLERNRVKPESLCRLAFDSADPENPPIGGYWRRSDGHFNAWSFYRAATAAEMEAMAKVGAFPKAEILDKTPYARSLRLKVASRTEGGKSYPFTQWGLPLHRKGDLQEFSSWLNLSHNSQDPDASYIGLAHQKRAQHIYWSSSPVIFGFNEGMRFTRESRAEEQFRANPYPIPANKEAVDFLDNNRLRSLKIVIDDNGKLQLDILYKTEIDKNLGARTAIRGYHNCWFNWEKRDTSYLFTPTI